MTPAALLKTRTAAVWQPRYDIWPGRERRAAFKRGRRVPRLIVMRSRERIGQAITTTILRNKERNNPKK